MIQKQPHLPKKTIIKPRQNRKKFNFFLPIPQYNKTDSMEMEIALRERIKELNCLYRIYQLAEHYPDSIDPSDYHTVYRIYYRY